MLTFRFNRAPLITSTGMPRERLQFIRRYYSEFPGIKYPTLPYTQYMVIINISRDEYVQFDFNTYIETLAFISSLISGDSFLSCLIWRT